jgi:hypothetical protein
MMKRLAFTFALGISLLFGASDSAPEWVREAATRTLPNYPAEVQAATLLHEEHVTVSPDGSTLTQEREAVRILAQEGASRASCGVPYFKKVTKIRDLKAWLIAPDGASKTYGKDYVLDVAAKEDFVLYEDLRAKVIEARNPVPGSTFGWSSEVEDHPHDPQILWGFQGRDPSLLSRLVLTLPQGWEAKAVTFNHEEIKPTVDGSTYTWELKDLNFIKRERSSPGPSSLSPWIGVTYYATSSPNAPREWKDISISESKLDEPQAVTNERLNAEVRQLTASASNSLDQIRAIGRYVQSLKYVEIATNLATGGGSLPHPAVQVFEKQYGDCKDKANLMRTMLRQIGVESYMVALFSGDRNRVRPEWPSGEQFNHMIIAIKVPDGTALPSTLVHPVLGKLLIFDSTDPYTPLGLLPDDEQGSYGLLLAGDKGGILQLPIAPPETNRTDVAVEGTLLPDGGLQAKLAMNTRADRAAELRATRSNHREDFEKAIQEWLQRNVKQVETEPLQAKDSFDTGELDVDLSFKAPRYGQLMQGRILVFKPAIVEPYQGFPVQSEKRENPLVLDSQCYHKQVRVKLPENFKIDEMPEAASFTSSFGKYSSDYKVANNELVFTEELDVSATTIPADKYKEARDFFGKVVGAERAPMVLVKN